MHPNDSHARDTRGTDDPISAAASHLLNASHSLADAVRCLQDRVPDQSRAPTPRKRDLAPDERITLKQLGAVRACARRAGLSEKTLRDLVAEVSGDAKEPTELTKAEASSLLDKMNGGSGFGR